METGENTEKLRGKGGISTIGGHRRHFVEPTEGEKTFSVFLVLHRWVSGKLETCLLQAAWHQTLGQDLHLKCELGVLRGGEKKNCPPLT